MARALRSTLAGPRLAWIPASPMSPLPKFLMLAGAALLVIGAAMFVGQRLGLGRLPGDISWEGRNFSFHFPLATSLVVSLVLSVLLNMWLGRSR
jgi:hypothetical protein